MLNITRIKEMVGITALELLEIKEHRPFLNEKKPLFRKEMSEWLIEFEIHCDDAQLELILEDFFESLVYGEYQEHFYVRQYHQAMHWRACGLNQSRVLLLMSHIRKLMILYSEEVSSHELAKGLCHVLDMSQSIVSTVYQVADEITRMQRHMEHELTRIDRSFNLIGITPPIELVQPYIDHQNWKLLAFKLAIGEKVELTELELSHNHCLLAKWLNSGGWNMISKSEQTEFDQAHKRVHKLGELAIECADIKQPERVLDLLVEMEAASTIVSDVLLNVIEDEFIRLATSDALTGLPNRRSFDLDFEKLFAFAERRQFWVGLVLVDVDHFKHINDDFGHLVGDKVLIQIAETVSACARTEEQAYRWGGEEFAVVTLDDQPGGAEALAERIRKTVEKKVFCEETPYSMNLTVSCGALSFQPPVTQPLHELFALVDKQLYTAKEMGRNRINHIVLE